MKLFYPYIEAQAYTKLSYANFVATLPSGKELIGTSQDGGFSIYGLSYGDTSKPTIMMTAQIHGLHEWTTVYHLRDFAKIILGDLDILPASLKSLIDRIKNEYSFYFMFCANPYGYENNTYANSRGVNLNRNFDYLWDDYVGDKGASPFSESESQIIRDKVLLHEPAIYLDWHNQGTGEVTKYHRNGTNNILYQKTQDLFSIITNSLSPVIGSFSEVSSNLLNTEPLSGAWVANVTTDKNGLKPFACTPETGNTGTDATQYIQGVNVDMYTLIWLDELKNITRKRRTSNLLQI